MFRPTGDEQRAWSSYQALTRGYDYETLQQHIIGAYAPLQYVVERYRQESKRQVNALSKVKTEVTEQNIALLKNSIELWTAASKSTDAVIPMLYHYSWHCFNSFLAYTFFGWQPPHAESHGINVEKWSDNIEEIKIRLPRGGRRDKSIFQRFVDMWTLLGGCSPYSRLLPTWEDDKIRFRPNDHSIELDSDNCLSAKQLLAVDSGEFGRKLRDDGKLNLVGWEIYPFDASIDLPTVALTSYVIIFVVSSLARYRPSTWNSVLMGKTEAQSNLLKSFEKALKAHTLERQGRTSNLDQIQGLFSHFTRGKFELKKAD